MMNDDDNDNNDNICDNGNVCYVCALATRMFQSSLSAACHR